MAITHLAFDMDGVIFSAGDFIEESYSSAIKKTGLALTPPNGSDIIKQFGHPVRVIFKNLFGELSETDFAALRHEIVNEIAKAIGDGKGVVYPGIDVVLQKLSADYTLRMCSNAGPQYVESILTKYDFHRYFGEPLTLSSTGLSNKSQLLAANIKKEGVPAENWVMVGDRLSDLKAARDNSTGFIGCTWGSGDLNELEGADRIINSPHEIINAVESLQKEQAAKCMP